MMIDLPAPEHSFASDNAAGASPEVLEALAAANIGSALAYGDDRWTRTAIDDVRRTLDAPAEVLFTWGGTGANVVGLGTLLQPWQAVICADSAHIVVDECGAPVRFTNSQLIPVATPDGKLRPDDLVAPSHWLGSEHHPQARVVSITQSTELGTLYTVDEIAALCDAAHALDMVVHLDGARIANAAAEPTHTARGRRYRVVNTIVANIVLSGSSAGNTAANAVRAELILHPRWWSVREFRGRRPVGGSPRISANHQPVTPFRWSG